MMKFTDYRTMKQGRFTFTDNRNKYIIDDTLMDSVLDDETLDGLGGGFPVAVLSHLLRGKLQSEIARRPSAVWNVFYCSFTSGDGRKYYVDFQTRNTCVYSDDGRRKYTFLELVAFRVNSYAPHCGGYALPDYSRMFGAWIDKLIDVYTVYISA